MSCRTTAGGTLTTRLARDYSGLSDSQVQEIYHALKREGETLPLPTDAEFDAWKFRQHSLIANSHLSDIKKSRSEHDLHIANNENIDSATFHAWANVERRARQESVIRELKGNVADLSAPGSQIANYTWGLDGRPARVWYASYGSNMDRNRFLTYVTGGTPKGSANAHSGCRDKARPEGDIPIRYRGRMHFAYQSRRWESGGVAFMDNDGVSHALGRAYNVSMGQFDDIVAQENGAQTLTGAKKTPAEEAIVNGKAEASHGIYGTMVHIGDYDGAPVFTFTSDFTAQESLEEKHAKKPDNFSTNKPSDNYIRMVGNGLHETFGMTAHQQADYLRGCPGMESMNRRQLLRIVRTPPTPPPPPVPKTFSTPTPTDRVWRKPEPKQTSKDDDEPHWLKRWDSAKGWDDPEAVKQADEYARRTAANSSNSSFLDDTPSEADDEMWRDLIASQSLTEPFPVVSPPRRVCQFCDQPGHKMNDCPKILANRTSRKGKGGRRKTLPTTTAHPKRSKPNPNPFSG